MTPPDAQPAPRTPDETLAAEVDRVASGFYDGHPYKTVLLGAAQRLRELAADMRWLEDIVRARGVLVMRFETRHGLWLQPHVDGVALGTVGPHATLAAAIADARQQLAQGGGDA